MFKCFKCFDNIRTKIFTTKINETFDNSEQEGD
jgi:hypothetical protein